jgi:hypothetical protein
MRDFGGVILRGVTDENCTVWTYFAAVLQKQTQMKSLSIFNSLNDLFSHYAFVPRRREIAISVRQSASRDAAVVVPEDFETRGKIADCLAPQAVEDADRLALLGKRRC